VLRHRVILLQQIKLSFKILNP